MSHRLTGAPMPEVLPRAQDDVLPETISFAVPQTQIAIELCRRADGRTDTTKKAEGETGKRSVACRLEHVVADRTGSDC